MNQIILIHQAGNATFTNYIYKHILDMIEKVLQNFTMNIGKEDELIVLNTFL